MPDSRHPAKLPKADSRLPDGEAATEQAAKELDFSDSIDNKHSSVAKAIVDLNDLTRGLRPPSPSAPLLSFVAPSPSIPPPSSVPSSPTDSGSSAAFKVTLTGATALSPPGEAELLDRVKAGDHLAFAQLYSLHKRRIYSLCLRMVGNVSEAEDLTQEAFLQLHRKISTFRGDSAFSTWMHQLAVNVVLMHFRKKGLSLTPMDDAMEVPTEGSHARSFGALDLTLAGAIDRMALERAVAGLPAGYRLVFVLHDIEGYEHNEIASLLECSIGNSKSQLHKARLKLRDALRTSSRQEAQR